MAQSSMKKSNDSPSRRLKKSLLGGEIHDCDEASVASHLFIHRATAWWEKKKQAAQISKNNAVRLCIPYMHI